MLGYACVSFANECSQIAGGVLNPIYGSSRSLFYGSTTSGTLWFYNTCANSSTAISTLSGGHMTPDKAQEATVMDAKYLSL